MARLNSRPGVRLLALGPTAGSIASDLARYAPEAEIVCMDVNPGLLDLGRQRARDLALNVQFVEADLNTVELEPHAFDLVFCHAALHHVIELEAVADQIGRALRADGAFITVDVVTRNGYLMWPETREVVQAIWKTLPAKFRLNHTSYGAPLIDDEIWQADTSVSGMECARSQDILPVLEQRFATERFVPYFSISRRFFDTMYGPNYDLAAPLDKAVFDWIWQLDVHYLATKRLRPETFFGIYRPARPSGSLAPGRRAEGTEASAPVGVARKGGRAARRVDLYAQCWNDEFMLPYFFRHYDGFVDRYVIFDDGSTDLSREILANHPRVELRRFLRSDPHSFALSEQALSDQCWKESRGVADWVIVTDLDEHLYHPALGDYLDACAAAGVTLVPALGFQMVSENLPRGDERLCDAFRFGAPWSPMMKPSIFDPAAIDEINFLPGRHLAEPKGTLLVPERDEVMLLHFKYLGRARTYARHRELLARLGQEDIDNNWGHRYSWSQAELARDWEEFAKQAVDVRTVTADNYPHERWWLPQMATVSVPSPAPARPSAAWHRAFTIEPRPANA